MRYYRFENYDNKLGKVVGGYISLMAKRLVMCINVHMDKALLAGDAFFVE